MGHPSKFGMVPMSTIPRNFVGPLRKTQKPKWNGCKCIDVKDYALSNGGMVVFWYRNGGSNHKLLGYN